MKRKIVAIAIAFAALGAGAALDPGGWNPETRACLDALIERNRGNPDAYAVFDFDYTTAIGDLSYLCMWRTFETMGFCVDGLAERLAKGIPQQFQDEARAVAALACSVKKAASEMKVSPTELPEWREFVRRYWALYRSFTGHMPERDIVRWRLRVFEDLEPERLTDATREAIAAMRGCRGLWRDPVARTEKRGFTIPPEMVNLFVELQKAGIAVYIVSASPREILLGATGPDSGLGIDQANVFGMELGRDGRGRVLPEPTDGGVKSRRKPEFIMSRIAPRHHGAEPVLTAGDSMGDYAMLTEFKDLQLALVFLRNWRERTLHDLVASGGRVVAQGRDELRGVFIPEMKCVDPMTSAPPPPVPPNWEPILTRPGVLPKGSGHVQGFCVTSNAIYATLHDGLYKFDWYGRLLLHVPADKHTGDICHWNGRLYTAVCIPKDVPKRGRIDVWDENLKRIKTTEFVRSADGITCMDGVLYVGLGPARDPEKPFRGNYFGKFDAETLQPLCEPFLVDHGYDCSAGVQNIATDGERLYINFYTPEEDYPCFFVFDKDFNVLQSHVFGWRHGVDIVGGGEPGAVRLIYAVTLNCWSKASKLPVDPAPPQNLFLYAELKNGKISDLTRYISFRNERKR